MKILCTSIVLFISFSQLLAYGEKSNSIPVLADVKVAFVLEDGATMIDFAGPWEVFQDVMMTADHKAIHEHEGMMKPDSLMPFQLFTVAENKSPRRTSGGMQVIPDYTYADAPIPNIVVVAAQSRNRAGEDWLRKVSGKADVILSVCTGAFILARSGLLDGKEASTHHWFQDNFEKSFPNIKLKRGVRFVDNGRVITSAGLSSGIDAALHIVERYYGPDIAQATAEYMEYRRGE